MLEAFIVRLYREKNRTGFLKAFTDQPEHITSGLSPLKNIMKELQLRSVHIYPRWVAALQCPAQSVDGGTGSTRRSRSRSSEGAPT